MTRLPMESWSVKARPDLPPYELSTIDARPGSTATATEAHHIWRRSFTAGPCWWVELENGTLVPNVVGLSQESHELIERGGHRIVAQGADHANGMRPRFFWLTPEMLAKIEERGENVYETTAFHGHPLYPQPGPMDVTALGVDSMISHLRKSEPDLQLDVEGGETPHDDVAEAHTHKAGEVPEGSTCPTCDRRVPRKKKSDSPATKTTSYRIPIGDVETHDEVLAAVSEHMGIGTKKAHWKFQTVTSMAAVVLSLPAKEVQAG